MSFFNIGEMPTLQNSSSVSATPLPAFVSTQVTQSRRFFLNLTPPPTAAIEVVGGGIETVLPEYKISRDAFAFYAIEFVVAGKGTVCLDGQTYDLSPGCVFAYGPRTAHTITNSSDASDPMRKYFVNFSGDQAHAFINEAGLIGHDGSYRVAHVFAKFESAQWFDMLIAHGEQPRSMTGKICRTLLNGLALNLKQNQMLPSDQESRQSETFERIRNHIDENYIVVRSVDEVAGDCGVSAVHLSRLFRRFAQCGAHQYLSRRKMNHAAGLLVGESMQVQQVAELLGFSDAFQFSRAFKRVYGIAPNRWKQMHG